MNINTIKGITSVNFTDLIIMSSVLFIHFTWKFIVPSETKTYQLIPILCFIVFLFLITSIRVNWNNNEEANKWSFLLIRQFFYFVSYYILLFFIMSIISKKLISVNMYLAYIQNDVIVVTFISLLSIIVLCMPFFNWIWITKKKT